MATQVGGVPEILPDDMIEFARADDEGEKASQIRLIWQMSSERYDTRYTLFGEASTTPWSRTSASRACTPG